MGVIALAAAKAPRGMLALHHLQQQLKVLEPKGKMMLRVFVKRRRPHPVQDCAAIHRIQPTHEVQSCQPPVYSAEAKMLCEMCFQAILVLREQNMK